MNITKYCKKCETEKPTTEFRKQATSKDGLFAWCQNCHDLDSESRYQKNKLKRIKQAAAWNEENKDKTKIYKKKYYESQKENETTTIS